jgi:hypothetical protein
VIILGQKGTIELRKYVDVARDKSGNHVHLTDESGEHHFEVEGKVGFRYFGALILGRAHARFRVQCRLTQPFTRRVCAGLQHQTQGAPCHHVSVKA